MAANDAFTAGVRPGGLTNSTEIRLLLCYLVKNAGPITRAEIENALMEEALVNYFEIGSCLDDIAKQQLVVVDGRDLKHALRQGAGLVKHDDLRCGKGLQIV